MELPIEVQIAGFFILISGFLIISLCLNILYKGIKFRNKQYILLSFGIFCGGSPYFPMFGGFIFWIFTKQTMIYEVRIFFATFFIPFALLVWLYIFTESFFPKATKKILIINGITVTLFEIYLFYILFFAPRAPITELLPILKQSIFGVTYTGFILIYFMIILILLFISGVYFGIKAIIDTNDPKIQWKGRFIITGWIIYLTVTSIDFFIDEYYILILNRIIIFLVPFFYYIGYILPDWVEKILKVSS